jgi:osmotically-inducible protein OsmY
MPLRSTNPGSRVRTVVLATLGVWVCRLAPLAAGETAAQDARSLESVVVTAKRRPEVVPDEVVTEHVAMALHSDRYFYDGHVTVTVKDSIVYLEGIVFDDGDLRRALQISRKIAGVKRVVNKLEICTCDSGGSG